MSGNAKTKRNLQLWDGIGVCKKKKCSLFGELRKAWFDDFKGLVGRVGFDLLKNVPLLEELEDGEGLLSESEETGLDCLLVWL